MKNHIMLDIETLDNEPTSIILSIAMVRFDFESEDFGDEFYKVIDLGMQLNSPKFTMSKETLKWWMMQNEDARKQVFDNKDTRNIYTTLLRIGEFITKEDYIWGNSNRFDIGVLAHHYKYWLDEPYPWDFRKEKDVRTLVGLNPKVKEEHEWTGIAHNALDDCKNQITYCRNTMKTISIN